MFDVQQELYKAAQYLAIKHNKYIEECLIEAIKDGPLSSYTVISKPTFEEMLRAMSELPDGYVPIGRGCVISLSTEGRSYGAETHPAKRFVMVMVKYVNCPYPDTLNVTGAFCEIVMRT